jgi:hypothetical protein
MCLYNEKIDIRSAAGMEQQSRNINGVLYLLRTLPEAELLDVYRPIASMNPQRLPATLANIIANFRHRIPDQIFNIGRSKQLNREYEAVLNAVRLEDAMAGFGFAIPETVLKIRTCQDVATFARRVFAELPPHQQKKRSLKEGREDGNRDAETVSSYLLSHTDNIQLRLHRTMTTKRADCQRAQPSAAVRTRI